LDTDDDDMSSSVLRRGELNKFGQNPLKDVDPRVFTRM
jgi:hypothetical protein